MSSLHSAPPDFISSVSRARQLFESWPSCSCKHRERRPPPGWISEQNASTSCLQGESGFTPTGAAVAAAGAAGAAAGGGAALPGAPPFAGVGGDAGCPPCAIASAETREIAR